MCQSFVHFVASGEVGSLRLSPQKRSKEVHARSHRSHECLEPWCGRIEPLEELKQHSYKGIKARAKQHPVTKRQGLDRSWFKEPTFHMICVIAVPDHSGPSSSASILAATVGDGTG